MKLNIPARDFNLKQYNSYYTYILEYLTQPHSRDFTKIVRYARLTKQYNNWTRRHFFELKYLEDETVIAKGSGMSNLLANLCNRLSPCGLYEVSVHELDSLEDLKKVRMAKELAK